ncbi:MAG TPA: MBL fold metallo-hydrolase [Chitinophagales bacterium]|nr:MBL fold metallo-hydrolase [Chitinophagales bacterium]
MKITFVNHSSFIVEHNGVSIIADPWLEGRVFNNGWELLSKSKFSYEDFKNIDYIWFSHEHPDHFYPPNLKQIPAEYKKNITVLFQSTIDGRVASYCRKAGFKDVIEMQKGTYYDLAPDFKVLCEYFDEGDSWIVYKGGGLTYLNTNDCGVRNLPQAQYIKDIVGKVDVLLTQFSYAYWAGNKEEVELRQRIADEKLDSLKFQCEVFKPTVTIPIASYVFFCHEENFYLNDCVNTAEKTYNYIKKNTDSKPVVLYNGDSYTFPQEWDSGPAIESFKRDFKNIELSPEKLVKNVPVPLDELKKQAIAFVDNLKKTNNFLLTSMLRPTHVHLMDYNKTFELSLNGGLAEHSYDYNTCDVSMSSESLLFCLKFPYGLDTTQINGRMQKPRGGNYANFYNLFRIDQQKSRGQEMTLGYLAGVATRKVMARLGLFKY